MKLSNSTPIDTSWVDDLQMGLADTSWLDDAVKEIDTSWVDDLAGSDLLEILKRT